MPEVRLIDANALKAEARALGNIGDNDFERGFCWGVDEVVNLIESAPTIDPEVRHGMWIAVSAFDACGGDEEAWKAHGNPIAYHYCSECKNETYLNEEGKEILSDYCPFCGADMKEEGADNG